MKKGLDEFEFFYSLHNGKYFTNRILCSIHARIISTIVVGLSRMSRCKQSLPTCSFCDELCFGISLQSRYFIAALREVRNFDPSDDFYGIKRRNWYCVLEKKKSGKILRMANLSMTQGNFCVDKYTNISISILSHWSNRRYEM